MELVGEEVEKLRLHKLLFLFGTRKTESEYDFVPFKFGCYSFSAKADMDTMVRKGIVSERKDFYLKEDKKRYLETLKVHDQSLLKEIMADYGKMNTDALIKHTYMNFPFYATHSTIVHKVLPEKLYDRVENAIPKDEEITLFSIGYEGISLEKYLLKLLQNNVKLLVDVRKNALSMKFGFSKTLLKRYCNSLGIEYMHIPEVGITSQQRQQLDTQEDYDKLFATYRKTTLKETPEAQMKILELLQEHRRIALTCFEAEPCQCHRTHLADKITKLPDFNFVLKHL